MPPRDRERRGMIESASTRARLRAQRPALLLAAGLTLSAGAYSAAAARRGRRVHGRQLPRRGARRQCRGRQDQGARRWSAGRLPLASEAARAGHGLSAHPAACASVKAGDLVDGCQGALGAQFRPPTTSPAWISRSSRRRVRDLLRREGIPFTGRAGPSGHRRSASGAMGRPARRRARPAWTNVWKGLDLEHALTPVKLQTLKKEIAPATVDALAGGDGAPFARWLRPTAASSSCIAVAEARSAAEPAQRHADGPRRRRRLHAAAGLSPRCVRPRLRQRAGSRGLARHHRGTLEGHQVARRRRRWRWRRPLWLPARQRTC